MNGLDHIVMPLLLNLNTLDFNLVPLLPPVIVLNSPIQTETISDTHMISNLDFILFGCYVTH